VTSQGSPHSRFRRALASGNILLIEAAARDLPQPLQLKDALEVLEALAAADDPRYARAAARFVARLTRERDLTLADARYVLALAEALPSAPAVGEILRRYCRQRP
jgi:hypothetical protein